MWDHEASAEEIALAEQLFWEAGCLENYMRERDYEKREPVAKEIIALYKRLVEIGNIDAIYWIGMLYYSSDSGMFDRVVAEKWLQKAASKGHYLAMYRLAMMLMDSEESRAYALLESITKVIDNSRDIELTDAYYQIAEMQWHGTGCEVNYKKALANYKIAARHNHYWAYYKLADLYNDGHLSHGLLLRPNRKVAAKCMENAWINEPETRYSATFRFAQMLNQGYGVCEDYTQAYRLFYQAALRRCGKAMVELAKIHLADELFPVDHEMAYLWLLISQSFDCGDYCGDRDTLKKEVRTKLSQRQNLKLQRAATSCSAIIDSYVGKKDLSRYMLSAEDYLNQYSHEKDAEPEQDISPETEDESSADEKAFQGVDEIRASFERDKVCFRIWIAQPIKAGAALDFETLKVKYDKRPLQIKHMPIYGNLSDKITPKTRNLLFRLAVARHLKQDDALVASIIKSASRDDVTSINRLFGLIFPNCWSKDSPAIKRSDGKLLIGLEIHRPEGGLVDTWIKHARDYDDLLHEKPENKDSRKKK